MKPFDILLVVKAGGKMISITKELDVASLVEADLEGKAVGQMVDLDLLVESLPTGTAEVPRVTV